ncbi:hypothetical protein EHYA_00436 [Embleya hyalina]|uniref:Uncharacterized protein n=1 Tax=Embleya hyalina TaxID=516124 RepID=A0A401YDW2_9ACTN|nr:hypothetical protein EHYA_00436 [Embleya hyalina]
MLTDGDDVSVGVEVAGGAVLPDVADVSGRVGVPAGVGAGDVGLSSARVVVGSGRPLAASREAGRPVRTSAARLTARVIVSGSQLPPPGPSSARLTKSISARGVGRRTGSLSRHAATASRMEAGSAPTSAGSPTTRRSTAAGGPSPNGRCPDAAYTIVEPSANTSLAALTGRPRDCSGDM